MATVDVGERGQMYKGEECRGQPMRKANTLWNVSRIEAKIRSHVAKTLLARNGNEASIPTASCYQGEGYMHNDRRLFREFHLRSQSCHPVISFWSIQQAGHPTYRRCLHAQQDTVFL